jgi:hypothetical protein
MRIHQAHLKEEQLKNEEIHNIPRIKVKMGRSMGMKSTRERLITDELADLLMEKIMMKNKKTKVRIEIGIRIKSQKIQTV